MGFVLAIDQGTTGTTVLVFDDEGRLRGRGYAEITQYYPQPGWVEHDPVEIWEKTRDVVGKALENAGIDASDLDAIGITNQRETTVLWEAASGRPVHRAIVWQDRRTAPLCQQLKARGLEGAFRRRTGLVLDPYFSGTKIRWLLDQDPELRRRAEQREVLFGTIDTWLLYQLTGGAVHATEPTNASRTLLYSLEKGGWDEELCDWLGVPRAMLPEVLGSSEILGMTDPSSFFGVTKPVSGMAGDQQAALFGQLAFTPGSQKNTYGTGCFLLCNTGHEIVRSKAGLLTTAAVGSRGETAYALEGSVFIAGAAVQWLRDGLGFIQSAAETEDLARSVESTDGVYLVPAFVGLGAPYWDPDARGALLGLTRGTRKEHIVRAALESIALQTYDLVEAIRKDVPEALRKEMRTLGVDGGASQNDWLMQLQADLLRLELRRPKIAETTAAGAAYLAGLGAGVWGSADELHAFVQVDRTFEPSMPEERRQEILAGWRDAVQRTLWRPHTKAVGEVVESGPVEIEV
jgi:glycerol kinase